MEEEECIIAEVRAVGSKRLNCLRCGMARLHRHGSDIKRRVLHRRSFSQVRRELGVSYGTLRRLLEREID